MTDFNTRGFNARDLWKDIRPHEHYQAGADQLLAAQLDVGMLSTPMFVKDLGKSCLTVPSTKQAGRQRFLWLVHLNLRKETRLA
jgi:hypothetical protein